MSGEDTRGVVAMPRIVAHRGVHENGAGGARENTLAAVRAARADGVPAVEIDVRLTRDGAVVVVHDRTFERLWGDPRAVDELDLADIRALGAGELRVPLLAEVLAELDGSGTLLVIDMDEPAPALPAVSIVQESPHEVLIAWCGERRAMQTVREQLPDAEIWLPWAAEEAPTAEELSELRPQMVNMPHLLVGAELVRVVHSLGCMISAWTVDDDDQAVRLAALGVDSVTTNRPAVIAAAIRAGALDEERRRLRIAREIAADAANAVALARRDGVGEVQTKSGASDHVTEIDRSIERRARAVLRAQFPEHAIVGEEYGGTVDGGRPCWYIDPVDGTANLANGIPWTSFSLALVEDGQPVTGAVLDPVGAARDGVSVPVPIVASRGRGAWRSGQRLRVQGSSGADPLRGAIVVTELAGAQPWPGMHRVLDALASRHCTLRIPGSGTASLAGIACGRGVAAMVHRYSPIDHAAAVLVVWEAGGTVLGADGEPTRAPGEGAVFAGADSRAARALWEVWDAAQRA